MSGTPVKLYISMILLLRLSQQKSELSAINRDVSAKTTAVLKTAYTMAELPRKGHSRTLKAWNYHKGLEQT